LLTLASFIDFMLKLERGAAMSTVSWLGIIAAVQLFLIFFYIHHRSVCMKLSYTKQRHEKLYAQLCERKNTLARELESFKDQAVIKAYAVARGMMPVRLEHIKRIEAVRDQLLQATP
jgi:hypothetical protein